MPTNTSIPTHSVGDVLSSPDWNTLTKLNSAVGLFGTASTITGSAPLPNNPGFYVQAGSYVYSGTSIASGTVSFPTAFPNFLLVVIVCNGDSAADNTQVQLTNSGVSLSQFQYALTNASTGFRINWIAIGG